MHKKDDTLVCGLETGASEEVVCIFNTSCLYISTYKQAIYIPSLTTIDCKSVHHSHSSQYSDKYPAQKVADRGIDSNNSHDVVPRVSVQQVVPRCNTVEWLNCKYTCFWGNCPWRRPLVKNSEQVCRWSGTNCEMKKAEYTK